MGFLFGGDDAPSAVPVPPSPMANEDAQAQRRAAEEAAIRESRAAGRRQTVVGGMKIAADEQYDRGLMGAKKRSAARDLGG